MQKMKKIRKRRKKSNIYILSFLLLSIFSISIGYASLNTELSISGEAYVRVDEDVRITNIIMTSALNEAYETYNPTYSKYTITMFTTLPNSNSILTYQVTIVNKSNKKYLVDNIIKETYTNTQMNYKINGLTKDDIINENETITFTISFNYSGGNLPDDVINTLSLKFDFIELNGELPPNPPQLASNMIPVYYDEAGGVWKKADEENKNTQYLWYNYSNKMWANVVTVSDTNRDYYLNAPLGTTISMNDINTMLVWIPRFNSILPSGYNGGTKENPGSIQISFARKTMESLDAFNFGKDALSGFWIAKFEISATVLPTQIDNNPKEILIKPNLTPWRYANLNAYFQASRNMIIENNIYGFTQSVDTSLDTHVVKNAEWGAVAYLTQSKYGRCINGICTNVYPNNCKSMLTGFGSNNVDDYQLGSLCSLQENSYNGYKGVNASTTGNIYGVYDMRGGINEYVMGNYNNGLGQSGFSSIPDGKYFNLYTSSTYQGHAMSEIKQYYNYFTQSWFIDSRTWLLRGGYFNDGPHGSVFYYLSGTGIGHQYRGSRITITI